MLRRWYFGLYSSNLFIYLFYQVLHLCVTHCKLKIIRSICGQAANSEAYLACLKPYGCKITFLLPVKYLLKSKIFSFSFGNTISTDYICRWVLWFMSLLHCTQSGTLHWIIGTRCGGFKWNFKLQAFLIVKYNLERLINLLRSRRKSKRLSSKAGIILLLSISCILYVL